MPESSSTNDRIEKALERVVAGEDLESVVDSLIQQTVPDTTPEARQVEEEEARLFDRESQLALISHIRLTVEKQKLSVRKLELENRRIELRNDQLSQNRSEREKYAKKIYRIVISWLVCVGLFLFLQGFSNGTTKFFELPTSALITAMGTTTASVLGIFIIVTNYLFPGPGKIDKQKLRRRKPQPPPED